MPEFRQPGIFTPGGAATLTRLNEAQTDLVRASGSVAASYIQYRLALINLNTETGRTNVHQKK